MKLSYVENFLNDLPDGINTIVGERGLKAFRRAKTKSCDRTSTLSRKSFLVFDEATASLDGIAESL